MNYAFLPDKVKAQLKAMLAGRIPAILVRANGDLRGQAGEGYVAVDGDDLLLYSRALGESDFTELRLPLGRLGEFSVSQEGGSAVLVLQHGEREFRIKAGILELKPLEPLRQRWQQLKDLGGASGGTAPVPGPLATSAVAATQAAGSGEITPRFGLAVALMFLAGADGRLDPEEDRYIVRVCGGDRPLLQAAAKYFRSRQFGELIEALSPVLNHEQRLCIMANLMDLAMCDGLLRSTEQRLLREFASAMAIAEDEVEAIRQVLMVKNKLSVLVNSES